MTAEAQDEGNDSRTVELRLQEVGIDLLQLVDAADRVEVRCVVFRSGGLERRQVRLGHQGGGDRIREDLVLELVHLRQGEIGAFQRGLERVIEGDESGDGEVDDDHGNKAVDEYPKQAIHAPDRLHTVEHAADGAADRTQTTAMMSATKT